MQIESVHIKNFRSITELNVDVKKVDDKECLIFLGKNESGKSNILKALALLSNEKKCDYIRDCNKQAKKEHAEILVCYKLTFNHDFYKKQFLKYGVPNELISIESIERRISIESDETRKDYFYIYLEDSDEFNKYVIDEITEKVEKIIDVYSEEEELTEDNISALLPNYKLCTCRNIENLIEKNSFKLLEKNTPEVIFWQSESQYLINEPINLLMFKDNSLISLPLRNIFRISGFEDDDIKSQIELIETDTEERLELSEVLSEGITGYINKVWSEHKINIKISIESDLMCTVNVEDQDNRKPKYKMDQRSDGFKQFISILLNLSAENSTEKLKDKLILLDEPEVHLHPSGIKFLRDELLRISENNLLMIATHSVHMIDKLNLNRHYSVSKSKSITELYQIQDNNPYEEEVIYESLGTSIYEHISPNMVVFEGKTDKDMFDEFSKKFKVELKSKNISAISANGVDTIPKYVKFFDGKMVKGYVLVDSDVAGQRVKAEIIKDNTTFNSKNTFEIKDIVKKNDNMTLEDLLPREVIEECLNNKFGLEITLDDSQPFIKQIKAKEKTLSLKDLKLEILKSVVNDLSKSAMTKKKTKEKYSLYYSFIESLYQKITS